MFVIGKYTVEPLITVPLGEWQISTVCCNVYVTRGTQFNGGRLAAAFWPEVKYEKYARAYFANPGIV